jgi:hypothetical protein
MAAIMISPDSIGNNGATGRREAVSVVNNGTFESAIFSGRGNQTRQRRFQNCAATIDTVNGTSADGKKIDEAKRRAGLLKAKKRSGAVQARSFACFLDFLLPRT